MLVGPVGDWAWSYPSQGQATSCAGLTALLKRPSDTGEKGVRKCDTMWQKPKTGD